MYQQHMLLKLRKPILKYTQNKYHAHWLSSFKYLKLPISNKIPVTIWQIVYILKHKRNATVFNPLFLPHGSYEANFLIIPPANFVCGGYTVFTLSVRACVRVSVRASVRPSVTFCFLNNSKSHRWIFIKPCKHVHICKTNTLDKKVRARGQFY